MKIFIDTATGTWGDAEDIVIYEASQGVLNMLNEMSDSEIVDFGDSQGNRLPTSMII